MPMLRLLARALLDRPQAGAVPPDPALDEIAAQLAATTRQRLGRSLAIHEVDAGSCNGCALEIAMLQGPHYDLERFGMRFVASPRHADVLMVTGPVTANMREALERSHAAMAAPKWVMAVGDCGIDGGPFCSAANYAVVGGAAAVLPVDIAVPGCPPSPMRVLQGLLALMDAVA